MYFSVGMPVVCAASAALGFLEPRRDITLWSDLMARTYAAGLPSAIASSVCQY
jgi:hypothetical protein